MTSTTVALRARMRRRRLGVAVAMLGFTLHSRRLVTLGANLIRLEVYAGHRLITSHKLTVRFHDGWRCTVAVVEGRP